MPKILTFWGFFSWIYQTSIPPSIPTVFSQMTSRTYLVQSHDFAIRLLDLAELGEEVPEAGFGDDIVGGEDAHAVELRGRVGIGRQVAPDDLVFLQATFWAKRVSVVLWSDDGGVGGHLAHLHALSAHSNFAPPMCEEMRLRRGGEEDAYPSASG